MYSLSQISFKVEELNRQNGGLRHELNTLQVEVEEAKELHRQREAELENELAVAVDSAETAKLELDKARQSLAAVEADYESYKTRAKGWQLFQANRHSTAGVLGPKML